MTSDGIGVVGGKKPKNTISCFQPGHLCQLGVLNVPVLVVSGVIRSVGGIVLHTVMTQRNAGTVRWYFDSDLSISSTRRCEPGNEGEIVT